MTTKGEYIMDTNFFDEMRKQIADFKAQAMAAIMKRRALDAGTLDKLGKFSMASDNAASNIDWMRSLYDELTAEQTAEASAEPADEMARAETGMQAEALAGAEA